MFHQLSELLRLRSKDDLVAFDILAVIEFENDVGELLAIEKVSNVDGVRHIVSDSAGCKSQ